MLVLVLVIVIETMGFTMQFDHEKLEVYQRSLDFVAFVAEISKEINPEWRNARDQLIRSSQSIPLNIAEGNGKRSLSDRRRYFEIARGSAMESAATLDVLVVLNALSQERVEAGKKLLFRIVSMLSKMTDVQPSMARESQSDYEYEHEHEHERST
ncbi:MAG: four helix bundle protein [Candidatus Hydrogenedentes bacterium]|nr:four helix bundle protein [Candidatus Hydrogenedentota bacterium]